jgi:hypothetical protein
MKLIHESIDTHECSLQCKYALMFFTAAAAAIALLSKIPEIRACALGGW